MFIGTEHTAQFLINELTKAQLTKPEGQVLNRILDTFLWSAEASALSYTPDARTHFQYKEPIASSLVEELRDSLVLKLSEVGITFEKTPGMRDHCIKGIFPVIQS